MTTDTVRREEAPSIGSRLRDRRTKLRLTLAEVASAADVSEGFLSQLERDRTSASIATLQRICGSLRITVGELFADPEHSRLHRYADAAFQPYGTGARKVRLTQSSATQLESFIGEFEPFGETGAEAASHGDSEECLLVVSGSIELTVGDTTHALGPLDSVTYRSSTPHRVRERAGGTAVAVWMISPPSF